MKIEDIKSGDPVTVSLGGSWREGVVEMVHSARPTYPDGYVQVDVSGITWLGTADKVRPRS